MHISAETARTMTISSTGLELTAAGSARQLFSFETQQKKENL